MPKSSSSTWPWWVWMILGVGALLVAVLVVMLVLLWVSPDFQQVSATITVIAGIATVIGVDVAVLAGFFAYGQLQTAKAQLPTLQEQLRTAQKIAQWDFVLRLDERFRDRDHLQAYLKLREGGDWVAKSATDDPGPVGADEDKDWSAVRRYMRLFERIYFLVRDETVQQDVVRDTYLIRLQQVTRNKKICTKIFREQDKEPWNHFIELWKQLDQSDYDKKQREYEAQTHVARTGP